MNIVYGTTNAAKIEFMRKRVAHLGIEILSLDDIDAPKLHVEEYGSSPLENARIKALAYYEALKMPVFSADSGLYIKGLDDARQPGINIRGVGDHMDDERTIAYYAALADAMGGKMTAKYKNAICLIDADGKLHEYMGDDIASEPFYIAGTPHKSRRRGFPLDSLSVDIASGKYYADKEKSDDSKYSQDIDGFADFFKRALNI